MGHYAVANRRVRLFMGAGSARCQRVYSRLPFVWGKKKRGKTVIHISVGIQKADSGRMWELVTVVATWGGQLGGWRTGDVDSLYQSYDSELCEYMIHFF